MADTVGAVLSFILLSLVGRLPLRLRQILGKACGTSISLIPTKDRKVAQLQLQVSGMSDRCNNLIRGTYQNVAISFFEALNLTPLLHPKPHVECPNIDQVKNIIRDGRGVVALTAHTGNWDLQGAYFVSQGLPVFTIGREARSRIAQHLLARMRLRYGIQTIWRSDTKALKEIVRVLQGGNVLAGLIDQDTVVSSAMVPFFGIPAKTPSSLIHLAKRWNCHIFTSFIVRSPNGKYIIHTEPVPQELSEDEILMLYHQRLESIVKAHPDQWVWFHKRWRSSTGTTLGSSAYISYLENALQKTPS